MGFNSREFLSSYLAVIEASSSRWRGVSLSQKVITKCDYVSVISKYVGANSQYSEKLAVRNALFLLWCAELYSM